MDCHGTFPEKLQDTFIPFEYLFTICREPGGNFFSSYRTVEMAGYQHLGFCFNYKIYGVNKLVDV